MPNQPWSDKISAISTVLSQKIMTLFYLTKFSPKLEININSTSFIQILHDVWIFSRQLPWHRCRQPLTSPRNSEWHRTLCTVNTSHVATMIFHLPSKWPTSVGFECPYLEVTYDQWPRICRIKCRSSTGNRWDTEMFRTLINHYLYTNQMLKIAKSPD